MTTPSLPARTPALTDRIGASGNPTATAIPGLTIVRVTAPTPLDATLLHPLLCLILQGRKETHLGDRAVALSPGQSLIIGLDLPSRSRVTADTAAPDLTSAMARLLALTDAPIDLPVLAPPLIREIHYRLLQAGHAAMLRHLARRDSHAARALAHLRADAAAPVHVPDLARIAGMSVSSFHQHFKAVTATTPLRCVKDLRLIEARGRLAAGEGVWAVAFAVGYESPNHFIREYSRKFGSAPSRDREGASSQTAAKSVA